MEQHTLMGGRLHLYKRLNSRFWQCSTYLGGKNRRLSTKQESLGLARKSAEEWFLDLQVRHREGPGLKNEKTFRQASEQFLLEYEIITEGQRNPMYVDGHKRRIAKWLNPFFGDLGLSEVTSGKLQEYRIHRRNAAVETRGKPPARNTMHQEIVTLRQIMKTAIRHGWIHYLPDFSEPYRSNSKISHRAWFSPEEYRKLYEATRRRAKKPLRKRWKWESEQMHDYVLFMANTGLRPDEAARLEYRDVTVVDDQSTDERILEIEVRGKRGVGWCKSMTGAVLPYQRLRKRNNPKPTDKLFPRSQRELFNTILDEQDLKVDREGQRRTSYSLRHTYICLRLMEGADIYQIAKNCRTSVEMIEKYYASHIKTSIDAAAVNVRRNPFKKRVEDARAKETAD
jgi:integrase